MLIESPGSSLSGAGGWFARPTEAAQILACRRWTDSYGSIVVARRS